MTPKMPCRITGGPQEPDDLDDGFDKGYSQ